MSGGARRRGSELGAFREEWSAFGLAAACAAGFAALLAAAALAGFLPLGRIDYPFLQLRADEVPGVAVAIVDPDGNTHAQRRRFVLAEDGRALGPASDVIAQTRERGHGAYSVWRGTVWFTASDGSDPLANGRRYTLSGPPVPPPWLPLVLAAAALAGLVGAAPGRGLAARSRALIRAGGSLAEGFRAALARPLVAFAVVQALLLVSTPWKPLIHWTGGVGDWARVALVALVVAAGAWWRARDLTPPLRLFYRVGLGLFVLAAAARHAEWLEAALWPPVPNAVWVLGFAALAWARPVFALPAILVYAAEHDAIVRTMRGFLIDAYVDWQPILELYVYFVLAVIGTAWARALAEGGRPRAREEDVRAAFLLAGAVHFANYFYSGVEKLRLEGGPLAWLLENETYRLAATALALGVSPVGSFSGVAAGVVEGWQALNLLGNAVTLGSQLAALLAAGFPLLAGWLCLVFDAWHIGVAVFTGIFFWKWIALNVTLAYAYAAWRAPVPPLLRLAAVAMVAAAPHFFSIAKLGWYDTPAVNALRVVAETRDGRHIPVPSDFFRAHSFQFIASAIWTDRVMREWMPTDTWGTTKSLADKRRADACGIGEDRGGDPAGLLQPQTADLVRLRHAQALAAPTRLRLPSDRLYPHHVFADPWGYAAFDRLDLRDVARYRIDLEALCIQDVTRPPVVVRRVTALVVPVGEP